MARNAGSRARRVLALWATLILLYALDTFAGVSQTEFGGVSSSLRWWAPAPVVERGARPAPVRASPRPRLLSFPAPDRTFDNWPIRPSRCTGGFDFFSRRAAERRRSPGSIYNTLQRADLSEAQLAANRRVLVVSSDNRPLMRWNGNQWDKDGYNHFASITLNLNREWAYKYGYDFVFVKTVMSRRPAGWPFNDHRAASCFHEGLQVYRVHNWCKVLVMWAAAQGAVDERGEPLYDLIVYLDSDAYIQDMGEDLSLAWQPALSDWAVSRPKFTETHEWGEAAFCAQAGAAAGARAAGSSLAGCNAANDTGPLLFMYSDNVPQDPGNPNLGFLVMRNTPRRAAKLLREWWDFSELLFSTQAFHEQTALWQLMQPARGWGGAVVVTTGRWAPAFSARFVRHLNSEEAYWRPELLHKEAVGRGLEGPSFNAALDAAEETCDVVDLDMADIAAHIDAYAREHPALPGDTEL